MQTRINIRSLLSTSWLDCKRPLEFQGVWGLARPISTLPDKAAISATTLNKKTMLHTYSRQVQVLASFCFSVEVRKCYLFLVFTTFSGGNALSRSCFCQNVRRNLKARRPCERGHMARCLKGDWERMNSFKTLLSELCSFFGGGDGEFLSKDDMTML